jgi:hypothetical protein
VFLCNTYKVFQNDDIPNTQTLADTSLPDTGFDCQLESVNGIIGDDNSAEKSDCHMDVDESSVADERKWLWAHVQDCIALARDLRIR